MSNSSQSLESIIYTRLSQALAPNFLEVIDEDSQHVGHAMQDSRHFAVIINSDLFKGKPVLECHRLIYSALGSLVGNEIHALRIQIKKD